MGEVSYRQGAMVSEAHKQSMFKEQLIVGFNQRYLQMGWVMGGNDAGWVWEVCDGLFGHGKQMRFNIVGFWGKDQRHWSRTTAFLNYILHRNHKLKEKTN